jgi:hypothetical protein
VSFKLTYTLFFFIVFSFGSTHSQNEGKAFTSKEILAKEGYNPLGPSTASFYSAIVPGMGQAYNKDYWKIPIVYGAMGTSIYYFVINNRSYKRYRTAFKQREAGFQDEFTEDDGTELISRAGLISAQKTLKNNRETSLLTCALFYVLQVVDASVSAHLLQFNVNDKLTFDPLLYSEPGTNNVNVGLTFNYNF